MIGQNISGLGLPLRKKVDKPMWATMLQTERMSSTGYLHIKSLPPLLLARTNSNMTTCQKLEMRYLPFIEWINNMQWIPLSKSSAYGNWLKSCVNCLSFNRKCGELFKQVCWIADHNLVIAASKNEDAPPVDVPDWHGHAAHAKTCLVLFGCLSLPPVYLT